ncbi:NusA-like transcription termination signal-binding factor [Halapricum desulfuricans]|uniref:Probable transcription termination protein NusA n=1 Tax=Halapricum desulfuricans TaxID=2841257 RepID=A0A897NQD7_9EURY|nr:NusA-like transcription termination signal-binding factor [Halapricum desulfuricans]QSG07835.1 Transcription elongation factor [Halapricum desulfuricans]QSG13039.1 Transcription elongation factor [Halapricum desulfuricans]
MRVTLSDEARQLIPIIEDETGATVRDCVIDEEYDRLLVLVKAGQMAKAIGSGGETVRELEDRLDRSIKFVEDGPTPEDVIASALAPAAVYNVTISENDDTVAYAEVDQQDTGVAIGADGRNIDAARTLAKRHFDIDDVEIA